MSKHVFIAMPYGVRQEIDFNRIYAEYLKPALEGAGFEVFRADEEMRAGNIHEDMFQELLLADLVVADLSIDNPNVWYELGIRHALRPRGVLQVQCLRDYMPFDVYGQRTLKYHIKDGVPDPAHLEKDKEALGEMAIATVTSWTERKISPVYSLLPYLTPPDWKSLRLGAINEFWEAYDKWSQLIRTAQRAGWVGNILALTNEAPARVLQIEAHRTAGKALTKLKHFTFALAQFEKALEIHPKDVESLQQKALLLGRLGRRDETKGLLETLILERPDDAEIRGLMGRIMKDIWVAAWRIEGNTPEQMREDAAYESELLRNAMTAYEAGFSKDPRSYYVGINALTLSHLYTHLTGESPENQEPAVMEGGIRWAIKCELDKLKDKPAETFWAKVTLGEMEVLAGTPASVERAYKAAVAVAESDWFALDSSQQQLLLLEQLGFKPENVAAGLKVFARAMGKLKPAAKWAPRRVILFSGHMIDGPDRQPPRFPADKEAIAAKAIAGKLEEIGAGAEDLAICGGACGGDLLFAEACLQRNLRVEMRIPFDVPTFLRESVVFAGGDWRERFYNVKQHANTGLLIMPEELGPTPKDVSPYERHNRWMLYNAQALGPEKVHFICLWNGQSGDGPGGTKHMFDTVKQSLGNAHLLDTTKLW
ncbi:MAG: TRAFs-binding domain-containing protein [Blastocatellia bacterium]